VCEIGLARSRREVAIPPSLAPDYRFSRISRWIQPPLEDNKLPAIIDALTRLTHRTTPGDTAARVAIYRKWSAWNLERGQTERDRAQVNEKASSCDEAFRSFRAIPAWRQS
jgi:hypothetical protein